MKLKALITISSIAFLTGCGGGSDTPVAEAEVIAGMNIPSSVSAVSDNSSSSSSVAGMNVNWSAVGAAYNSPSTDYTTDNVDSWIDNPTAENISFVNMLLCIVDMSKAEQFPNSNYRVLVDFDKCDASASSGTSNYASGVVSSTRDSNNSNQVVKVWFDYNGDDGNEKIMVKLIIQESSSIENPLGKFTMNFTELAETPRFTGYMKIYGADSGSSYIKLWEENMWNGGAREELALHIKIDDVSGASGSGLSIPVYKIDTETQYIDKIAYNKDYVKAHKDATSLDVCYDRNDLYSSIYRTKLYEKDTGKRLDLKGGFSATYTKDGIGGNYAYFGDWGLWTENANYEPTQITRRNEGGVYDMVYAPGKFEKHSKQVAVLADGDKFRYWDWSNRDSEGNAPRIDFVWQASDNTFRKSNGDEMTRFSSNRKILENQHLWSLQYNWSRYFIDNSVHKLSYTKTEQLNPWNDDFASGDISLTCVGTCPTEDITQAGLDGAGSQNSTDNPNWTDSARSYTFDKESMTLKYNGTTPIKIASNVTDKNRAYDIALALSGSGISNIDGFRNETTTYLWRPSLQNWGRATFAKDSSSNWYKFDKPVEFEYTHSTANDKNESSEYNGKIFYLSYNGSYIGGLPSGDDSDGRWIRFVNLNNDIELYTDADGKKYINKAVGIDKKMKKLTSGDAKFDACNALDVSGVSLDVPGVSGVTEITETWDEQNSLPGLSDDISVIHGIIQRGL